jgi:hypothetical protein
LRNFEDAQALYQEEKDPFYLAAFLIQCWLGNLMIRAAGEYAEKKNPKERALQNGEAWRNFRDLFGLTKDKGLRYLLSCLFRFSASDDSPGNSLRRALVPLSLEHRSTSDFFGPKTIKTAKHPKQGNELARRTIVRWCDWLDADIHLRTHRRWHTSPACFDPDPETRELAALGNAQRHLAQLDPHAKASWLLDFANAAERYQHSPKWAALGKAMADNSDRSWPYAEVDTLVIALWPLVKAHNWTYRDLLNVIRPALKRPSFYPCEREQDFAAYCANVLGLRKTSKGVSAKNGRPAGYEIATKFCPALGQG